MKSPIIREKEPSDGQPSAWDRRPEGFGPHEQLSRVSLAVVASSRSSAVRYLSRWAWRVGSRAAALAFVVDGTLVFLGRHSLSSALICAIAAAALAALFGLGVSPLAAYVVLTSATLRRLDGRLVVVPAFVAPLLLAMFVTASASEAALKGRHAYEVLAFAGIAGAVGLLAISPTRMRRAMIVAVGVGAIIADVSTPRAAYRDVHDLCGILSLACLAIWSRRESPYVGARVLGLLASAIVAMALLGLRGSGWRTNATRYGHFMPRMAGLFRRGVDFDGDGYSPIAWGGDCDDRDPRRNPFARETRVGFDANCNGFVLPANPTDEDRGVARPAGPPDAPRGSVDRFVLVVIDCMRSDGFRPEVMPNLTRFAARGVVLERLYAGGARTNLSFPLIQKGSDDAPPVALRLARNGVTSAAIFGTVAEYATASRDGFTVADVPTDYMRPAPEVTDRAIADLEASRAGPHYLLVHYFDAHNWTLTLPPGAKSVRLEDLAAILDPSGYYAKLGVIDRELGRLLAFLDGQKSMEKTAVLVTADHGESFGAHGVWWHATSTYEDLVHVPGVFVAPGLAPGVYDGLASHRDLPATIMGAFGLVSKEPDVEQFGRSLWRLAARPMPLLHEFVVSRGSRVKTLTGWDGAQASIVEGSSKLVKTFEDGLVQMYDLKADPNELKDADPDTPVGRRMAEHLERFRDLDRYP